VPAGHLNPDFRQAPLVLLDDSRPGHRAGRSLLFDRPDQVIVARSFDELPAAFAAMDAAYKGGLHLAGWVSYECARHFEPRLETCITETAPEPLVWMIATKHRADLDGGQVQEALHRAQGGNARMARLTLGESPLSKDQYLADIGRIHDLIRAGDVYQINHTFPLPCRLSGDPLTLFETLRASQPVPFGAYLDTGESADGFTVLSLSPELFLRRRGDLLISRPMKGTAPRGLSLADDEAIMTALASDEKSRAENLMIVDLIRNDLSRISVPGSVKVNSLFEVERYRSLHQMTSSVQAQARDDLVPSQLLAGLFPCGSVTGAPKVHAMEVIASLEKSPRGVYCGAIGHFSPPGKRHPADWALNVPIRTLVLERNGAGRLSVGSGVVADSSAAGEYEECLLKARFAAASTPTPFSLIETFRLSPDGSFNHLNEHLARLKASATYFDYAFDADAVHAGLQDHVASLGPLDQPRRARLLLAEDGSVSVSSLPLVENGSHAAKVCLSATAVRSDDVFLYHKTTRRTLYDAAFTKAHKAGFDDLLFFNERNELTEGAVSNVFINSGGSWMTPPVSAGVLPGILRQQLLNDPTRQITVQTIRRQDLLGADEIYIGNSLRGLRRAILTPSAL